MPSTCTALRDVVASGIKQARLDQGLRQDDAARRLRDRGLASWQRGTVAQAETGSRRLSLEELLAFALIYETTPAALVAGGDNLIVEIAPGLRLTTEALRGLLTGHASSIHTHDPQIVDEAPPVKRPPARSSRFPDVLGEARRLGVRRHADVDQAVGAVSDAERHAARKLGTTPERIALAAFARWGRPLAAERDRRVTEQTTSEASTRTLQALRGHVTRELTTELETDLQTKGLL